MLRDVVVVKTACRPGVSDVAPGFVEVDGAHDAQRRLELGQKAAGAHPAGLEAG